MNDASAVAPQPAAEITEWAGEADVVVIGYGIAGVCAAIEAARAGADVLVLERTGGWGGAAALAGGFIYLGGGTDTQRALGFDDTVENMAAFLIAAIGPTADQAKIADYCQGSTEHHRWLVEAGVVFKDAFWGEPGWEPPHDEGLMYSGGENAAPFNALVPPAPRGHVPQMANKRTGEQGGGYMLMKPLVETAEKLGVRAEYDTRLQRLITDGTGRVVGVAARRYGAEVTYRARRGVVLGTGSFAYNQDMVAQYAPQLVGRPAAAIEEHDGIGIRVGQGVGGQLDAMAASEVAFFGDPQLLARGILVNGAGQRYIAEDTYPGRIGQATLLEQDNQAFLIIDDDGHEAAAKTETSTPFFRQQPTWVAETVAELESAMGLAEGALQRTVAEYNENAAAGVDPVQGKKPEWLTPIGSPLAGYDMRGFTAGFPLGGLRTDLDGRVLDAAGTPIPGLYAAGRCTAGICTGGYASGASLGDGSFYGRRAGVAAAADE
ncbi:FAD-dependent oxidoreductase [Skermania piniformis]|uniref:FAD-dependent oxidoreductase n=1 Tax=Skermania pinensis TaxID=39122 RepID=A0ABX8S3S5_9ACTN|nr:FAD-dependent oxidoreductase [Skermania piniformis]QXQ12468.1 FAD-dependent oxidoreductase [Skermania piniformis]